MTAEAPKPNEENQPRNRGFRPFDELQVRYRSEPWHKNGGRFDYINFKPRQLPDLYATRDYAAEERYRKDLEELTQRVAEQKTDPQA